MAIGGSAGGNYSPQMYGGSYRGSPYSVQNILNQDRFGQRHGYGMSPYGMPMNPYAMSMQPPMMPDWGRTQWMNPYSGPYARPYFPQTTGSFFRNNAPAFGWYGQPETFGRPGQGYPDPFGVNPYSSFNYGQYQPILDGPYPPENQGGNTSDVGTYPVGSSRADILQWAKQNNLIGGNNTIDQSEYERLLKMFPEDQPNKDFYFGSPKYEYQSELYSNNPSAQSLFGEFNEFLDPYRQQQEQSAFSDWWRENIYQPTEAAPENTDPPPDPVPVSINEAPPLIPPEVPIWPSNSYNYGMGGPSKGAPQQGYNPYGMYDNQGGFTPSNRPPVGQGGGKGGREPQQGYNPNGMYDVVYNPETGSFDNAGFTPSDRPAVQPAPAGGPSKGAPQQGYNPNAMYDNEGGFTTIEEWLKNNPSAYNNIVNTIGGRR